jgi:hypothetical protein
MAWSFRRSLKFGPSKINLSKSGVGFSFGVPGFRVGQDAKGRSYRQVSIPGTGVYNRTYGSGSKSVKSQKSAVPIATIIAAVVAALYLLLKSL